MDDFASAITETVKGWFIDTDASYDILPYDEVNTLCVRNYETHEVVIIRVYEATMKIEVA